MQSSVVGLPPSTLNTLEKLSAAISNDPNYFTTTTSAINAKANQSNTYTKAQTDTKINDLVGAAPDLLNTLSELSDALGDDHNYAATITTALAAKANTSSLSSYAPLASPTFTGQTKAPELRTNNIYGDTATQVIVHDNVIVTAMSTLPDVRVNTLIAHSTNQVNINDNLTVSGNLLVGTTNVLSTLNSKSNTSDVYTKIQTESGFQPKIDNITAPLKYTESILTGVGNTLSLDTTGTFSIAGNLSVAGL